MAGGSWTALNFTSFKESHTFDVLAYDGTDSTVNQALIEKKIPVLEHFHTTKGLRHAHALPDLTHSHRGGEDATGEALEGSFQTEDGLEQDAFDTDKQLPEGEIVCYEHGKPLPVEDGYIILNRGLEMGDRVLMLRVMRGQQFIILSRIFEGSAQRAASI